MERLTRTELGKTTNAVICNHSNEDCNDSCMYGTCKWNAKALQRLKEYEDAEEQGLFLKPICKPGADCYFIKPNQKVVKGSVLSLKYDIDFTYHVCTTSYIGYDVKIIYLTREAAEKALRINNCPKRGKYPCEICDQEYCKGALKGSVSE